MTASKWKSLDQIRARHLPHAPTAYVVSLERRYQQLWDWRLQVNQQKEPLKRELELLRNKLANIRTEREATCIDCRQPFMASLSIRCRDCKQILARCKRKRPYGSASSAGIRRILAIITGNMPFSTAIYLCPLCQKWHMTSNGMKRLPN